MKFGIVSHANLSLFDSNLKVQNIHPPPSHSVHAAARSPPTIGALGRRSSLARQSEGRPSRAAVRASLTGAIDGSGTPSWRSERT